MSSPPPPPSPPTPSTSSAPAPIPAQDVSKLPVTPKTYTGWRAAIQFTGIPPSIFDKKPKLPSRNWLIFISVVSTVGGYYVYDRRECKRIRNLYVERVRPYAEEKTGKFDLPRKVTVYGAKWPGDEDWDRSTRYFRKYLKPVFVAAAVDYQIIGGKKHGDIATRVANDVKDERRLMAGLDEPWQPPMPNPLQLSPEDERRRKLEGGTVIIGRHTLKEYMTGLINGWTSSLQRVDPEDELSRVLAADGRFDEPEPEEPPSPVGELDSDEPIPTPSRLATGRHYSPFDSLKKSVSQPARPTEPAAPEPGANVPPPDRIPPQPPLLFVPFRNLVGLKLIPLMIWDFFNERKKVQAGAEAAYSLILNQTRPFVPPTLPPFASEPSESAAFVDEGDLAFDRDSESYYKSSTAKLPAEFEKAREEYYKSAMEKLKTARALARREREPTDDELKTPPPTEVELHAERLKKEMRWCSEEKGWEIIKPDAPAKWDERLQGALRVFVQAAPLSSETTVTDTERKESA